MIIVSSLSPKHSNSDNQHNAIKSWRQFGMCYSMNNAKEIADMRTEGYDILFIQTEKTLQAILRKPLVNINAIIDLAITKDEDLLIINSDILLPTLPEFRTDGVTLFSRFDYTDTMDECKKFEAGFDVFFIPKHFLRLFPPSIYSLGSAWWDYWIPFHCIHRKIALYYPDQKYAYHKWHETQYSQPEWLHMGEYFKWEFNWDKAMQIPQIATAAITTIKSKLIIS